MILLGSTCHRVKKCAKISLDMAKYVNQFVSHTFYDLIHLFKVSYGRIWLPTKQFQWRFYYSFMYIKYADVVLY